MTRTAPFVAVLLLSGIDAPGFGQLMARWVRHAEWVFNEFIGVPR